MSPGISSARDDAGREFRRPVIANIARLNQFMDQNRLVAVVVRSGENFTYLSGIAYPGTLARHLDLVASPRGSLVFWPRTGEPVIIVDKVAEPLTQRDSWIRRVESYEAYCESLYQRLADVIKDHGADRERVGFEKNYLSATQWDTLRATLPHLQLVDCTVTMDQVRSIKTPGEIELLRKGADLLDEAYLEVFPTIRVGQTEREVHAKLICSCIRRGAGWAHGILNSSSNTILYGGEGDTVFGKGDVVRTDYVAYLQGYPGHQSRNAILGAPSPQQRREYTIVRDVYRMTIDRCRPGIEVGDLWEFVIGEYVKHGWEHDTPLIGHSVGPWWHQQEPILSRGSHALLEENMVLALEPHKEYWHIQDMVVIHEDGPELISNKFATDELYVID